MQEDDHHHRVFITKTITVHPKSQPQTSSIIHLSNLDRKCPLLMYLVFFYKSPPPTNINGLKADQPFFISLKTGLEETLSAWYPAAGRLFLNPESGKLDLLCCNSGVLLVEATTQVKISELGDLSQYNSFFEELVFRPTFSHSHNLSEMPLVVAQLTKFGCGGYALGVGTNHSLFDGPSNFNFLQAWAAKTRMEEAELVEPVHERGRFLVGHGETLIQYSQDESRVDIKDNVASVIAFDHLHQLIKQDAAFVHDGKFVGYNFSGLGSTSHEHYVLNNFSLSSAMVTKLKIGAGTGSSFEVVAAHLWRAKTKALGISKERMVCLQFTVNTRKMMVPQRPKSFTGNAYVLSSILCTSGELEDESFATVVEKIKQAKRVITKNYVLSYLEALEAPQCTLPPLHELIIISDWTKTPYHEVDFGLGVADYVVPLGPPIQQVAYFMQSPREVGGIDLRISLLQEHVLAFSHYFNDIL